MIHKDFPHGPCISEGTTTNSSPGVAHGALDKSRTSPGMELWELSMCFCSLLVWGSSSSSIWLENVGKSNRIETC